MKAKMIAPVFWASAKYLEKGRLIRLERHQCELSLELKCHGHSYRVVARKKKEGTTYVGKWIWANKQNILEGDVTFDFLATEDGFLAFGKWKEDGEYQWWFRLPSTGVASHLSSDDTNVHIGDGMDWHGWSTNRSAILITEVAMKEGAGWISGNQEADLINFSRSCNDSHGRVLCNIL